MSLVVARGLIHLTYRYVKGFKGGPDRVHVLDRMCEEVENGQNKVHGALGSQ
jgi:hypothetical protein